MENARATAEHWRALARETQATAERVEDVRERLALLLIARAYEQLAKTADRMRRSLEDERAPTLNGEPRASSGAPLGGGGGFRHPEAIVTDGQDDEAAFG